MRKSIIPPRGAIPPDIRGGRRNIGLGLNINIGLGGLGGTKQSWQKEEEGKFKPRTSQREKPGMGEKINLEELKNWAIDELSHLLELERYGWNVTKKMAWILGFIPEGLKDEILKKAKEISDE